MTGESRGFGFVTIDDPTAADKLVGNEDLEIQGRKVRCFITPRLLTN